MGGVKAVVRVAAALLVIAAAVPAAADARLQRCGSDSEVRCGRITVPLDRSGRVPGQVSLYAEHARTGRRSQAPVFALAGGPGQPATQFTGDFIFAFADDGERDVVTFDQRGTGRSGLLRCKEIEEVALLSGYPAAAERCAQRLGARRAFYTKSDSVDDMEAVRREIGARRSRSTARRTAPRSRWPTPRDTRSASSGCCSTPSSPLMGRTRCTGTRSRRRRA